MLFYTFHSGREINSVEIVMFVSRSRIRKDREFTGLQMIQTSMLLVLVIIILNLT